VVVDEQQRPLGGMTVRLIYQDYSLESRSHEEMRTTDARGHASFEQRSIRSTAASHIVGSIRSFAHTGFHASYGRDAYIVVFGKGRRGDFASWDTWSGWSASMHSTIKTIPDTAIR
jgi:hypothetical protein